MFVNRTRGVVAATVGAMALGACADPAQDTDLRPEGPPDVLAVLVMTDAAAQLKETATYCKKDDAKRPAVVGLPDFTTYEVCPTDISMTVPEVSDAYPDGWYIRVMFDELLDPEIETLTEILDSDGKGTGTFEGSIAASHPVELKCESVNGGMVSVDYDGYYQPAGNRVTWPVGPSLVIKPNDPTLIATNTSCELTLNTATILDKQGETVPTGDAGPYKFKVAPIKVIATDPSDGSTIDASQVWGDNIYIQFNTKVNPASLCDEGAGSDECEFTFTPDIGHCSTATKTPCEVGGTGGCPGTETCVAGGYYAYSLVPYGFTDTEFGFGPNLPVENEKDYTFEFVQGGKLKDRCGRETTLGAPSADDLTSIAYTTNPFDYNRATIATGETSSAMKKLQFIFSNVLDLASLDATEYSITPAPVNGAIGTGAGNDIRLEGFFKVGTEYTFTLNAGATIKDYWGVEYTNPEAKTITWKTQPAITTTVAPANNATLKKAAATSTVGPTLTFNAAIKVADITEGTDFTVTDSNNAAVTGFTVATTTCAEDSTSCSVTIKKNLPDGTYTFTLKAGATFGDEAGDTYTQAEDKVVHFTVVTSDPATPIQCL